MELVVVIAVIGILAAVAIPIMANNVKTANAATAQRNLNLLNGAVQSFNQANWELVLATSSGSDDERAIFDSLRYRNPDVRLASPGSPYLPPNATFVASSDTNTYRALWNGRLYEFKSAGTAGTGLDLMKIMGAIQSAPTNTPIPRSTNG